MTKQTPKPQDLNQMAAAIVSESTADFEDDGPEMTEESLSEGDPDTV
jgi:hypothetical protein